MEEQQAATVVASDAAASTASASIAESDEAQRARRERILALKRDLVGGDLLSAAEVAEILDIHPRTVGEYIRDGKMKAFQFGGGWKISESALRAFVREQTQGAASGADDQGTAVTALSRAINGLLSIIPGGAGTPAAAGAGATKGTAGAGVGKGGAEAARRPQFKCSFCGKDRMQVRRLIAGPGGVYICDQCVGLCNEIIAKETAAAPEPAE